MGELNLSQSLHISDKLKLLLHHRCYRLNSIDFWEQNLLTKYKPVEGTV